MTAPHPAAAPPHGDPPRPGRTRGGTVVVVVLVLVILLCLGLGTTGYLLVGRVPPGARTPAAAADGLLDAVFHRHDIKTADRYVCAAKRDTQAVRQLVARGARYQDNSVSWSAPAQVGRHGDRATVRATLTLRLRVNGATRTSQQKWTFDTVDEHGWRVCGIKTGNGG